MELTMSLRLKAFLLHLSVSALLLSVFTGLVLWIWYAPWPLLSLQGGVRILGLMILVDVVLGPSFTWLVVKPDKSRRMLVFDVTAIVLVQLAAFVYGAWTLYSERPLFLALVEDRFEVVRAPDINPEKVDSSVAKSDLLRGAQWVRVEIPNAMLVEHVLSRAFKSPGMELKPAYYRPLSSANREAMGKLALSVKAVQDNGHLAAWLQSRQLLAEKVWVFPVNGRSNPGFAVLAKDSAEPLVLLD